MRRVLAAGLFLGSFGIALWSFGPPEKSRARTLRFVKVETSEFALPVSVPTQQPVSGEARTVAVHVYDSRDGKPIAGADVLASLAHPLGGIVAQNSVLGAVVTADDGGSHVPVDHRQSMVVSVRKSGYVGKLVTLAPQQDSLRVPLQRGAKIRGRVQVRRGGAVANVTVRGVPQTGPGPDSRLIGAAHDASFPSCQTDSHGRFELDVREGGLLYRLEAFAPGIATARVHGESMYLHARAGDTGLVLLVDLVRLFQVLLVHAETGRPVATHASVFSILPNEGVRRTRTAREFVRVRGGWAETYSRTQLGLYLGCVRVEPSFQGPPKAELAVALPGFRPVTLDLILHDPKSPAAGQIQRVELRPAASEFGALRIKVNEGRGTCAGDPRLHVRVDSSEAIGLVEAVTIAPTGSNNDGWLFEHVPAGHREIQLWDGVSATPWTNAAVEADATTGISLELSEPSGVSIRTRDKTTGRYLPGAAATFVRLEHALESASSLQGIRGAQSTRLSVGRNGRICCGVDALNPGRYLVVISKPGFAPLRRRFDVAPTKITELDVLLTRHR